ncbi:hypothetical protein scyTo_0004834 [Scyliorhinus torazame]|uniref:Uncharacterized protein n=1 Tax=Scyliorhinus torazame TaxID=75743 RepID=A0A401NXS2_SCYTO|nr:hypothetical protein [Scyliorhinus torazame]
MSCTRQHVSVLVYVSLTQLLARSLAALSTVITVMSSVISDYLSCSPEMTQRKTLPQLLGTRTHRLRQRCSSEIQLKETVIRFMRHHQNLGDLLLEVNGSLSGCSSHRGKVNSEAHDANIPGRGPFIVQANVAEVEQLTLEIVWHLHKENIVSLEELIVSNPDATAVTCWLFSDLCLLCLGTEDHHQHEDIQRQILSDIVTVLVTNGFQELNVVESDPKLRHFPQICFAVLGRMIPWLLDNVWNEKENDGAAEQKAAQFWLSMFDVASFHGAISVDSLKQFFYHTLTQILTYNPVLEASDAIRMQGGWCFAKSRPLLITLYRKLFVVFSAAELITHFQQVLETHEVNWQNVLSCASTQLVCQPQTQQHLKELLARLLINSFENYELESIITAFLLARQAALEGPAVFISYSEWFKNSFGSASSYHGSSKKSLIFLLKFLTDLVPFETAQYLKVHILYPPYVASKYRVILLEYISLAKTRLSDLQVSIEELGLYEDLSTAHGPPKPQCQAMQDVERAILIFENSGKIPASVMEASIFRRPYYLTRFLPALLTPRVLPVSQDSRVALINSLKKADKIPDRVYLSYVHACEREHQHLLEGVSGSEEMQHLIEPVGVLTTALEELNKMVTNPSNSDVVSAQIAVISSQLKTMIDDDDDCMAMDQPIQLDTTVHKLGPVELEVRDLLLKSFCQTFLIATNFNPPQRQGEWASLFVKMLCGHRRFLHAVLTRVLHLTSNQGPSLADVHILGLAAFTVQVHILEISLSLVNSSVHLAEPVGKEGVSFAEYLNQSLTCGTREFATFCMRFCTAAVVYAVCLSTSSSIDNNKQSVPPGFMHKLQYIIPRLIPEARQERGEVLDPTWNNLLGLPINWATAALSVFKHPTFKELVRVKDLQLTFHDWLMSELAVQPDKDLLSDLDRQDYQHWACYQLYLPSPPSAGGCGGDLVVACRIIINALMDFSKRTKVQYCKEPDCSELPSFSRSCYESIICRLQEMVFDLEKVWSKALGKSPTLETAHFLLDVFQDRRAKLELSNFSEALELQTELQIFVRILVALPPSLLFRTRKDRLKTTLECEAFFHFTNTELRNDYSKEFVIPFGITLHFFRGLLNACIECEEAACAVAEVLNNTREHCPLLLLSAAFWWLRLEPVLVTQWKRISDTSLPKELQRMIDNQCWANSLVDLISSLLQPKESPGSTVALKTCAELIMVLEEQNKSWLNIFLVSNKDHGPHQILYGMISDMEIKLLPVAFFSLIPGLDPKLLTSIIKHADFLSVAIILYTAMVNLFLDGEDINSKQPDPLGLITRGRQFLLHTIPQCPAQTIPQNRLQAACKDIDPELKAALSATVMDSTRNQLFYKD